MPCKNWYIIKKETEGDKEIITASIYSDCDYAWFVEFGTRHQAPQAFLRRGLASSTSSIINIFGRKEAF